MWGWLGRRKKAPPIRSLIGEATLFQGDVTFSDGLRIDGTVVGNVSAVAGSASLLVIGENARVHGSIVAGHVIINGEVRGAVRSDELIELQPKARIDGDVRYEAIEMHPGALVQGKLVPLESAGRPTLKLAASNDV